MEGARVGTSQALPAPGRLAVADSAQVEHMRRRATRRHRFGRLGLYLLAIGAALVAALPFIWGTITAFKEDADLYNSENNPFVFNLDPTGEHISFLFNETEFLTFAVNGLPAAYSLARLNMPWAGPLGIAIFFVYLVPPTLLFISLTRVVAILGLQDSTWSLVVIYPTITIPVSVWLLIGFFKAVPRDLEEQAMVDGYSRLSAFVRIVIPLALPGIIAVLVFAFTLTAHEFIYALAFISPTDAKTISIGVPTELIRGDVFFWQSLQAAAILVAVPIAFVFTLLLERFITGFTMGAVKG
jgi:multiple sugar transport system permease protein